MFSTVYITAGSREEARKIGRTLVEERLAACVNIFPIHSIYWWEGLREEDEFALIVKTRRDRLESLEQRVKEIHSYETPCIVSFAIEGGSQDFFDWLADTVSSQDV